MNKEIIEEIKEILEEKVGHRFFYDGDCPVGVNGKECDCGWDDEREEIMKKIQTVLSSYIQDIKCSSDPKGI